ncbi:hypothetical protein BH11PSE12_BH11PSE12_19090 [soil metagenome]
MATYALALGLTSPFELGLDRMEGGTCLAHAHQRPGLAIQNNYGEAKVTTVRKQRYQSTLQTKTTDHAYSWR